MDTPAEETPTPAADLVRAFDDEVTMLHAAFSEMNGYLKEEKWASARKRVAKANLNNIENVVTGLQNIIDDLMPRTKTAAEPEPQLDYIDAEVVSDAEATDHLIAEVLEKNRQKREAAARTTNHERELRRRLRERTQLTPDEINEINEGLLKIAYRTMGRQGQTIANLRGELARVRGEHSRIERGELRRLQRFEEMAIEQFRLGEQQLQRASEEIRRLRGKLDTKETTDVDP